MTATSPEKERQMLGLFLVPGVYMRVLAETVGKLGHNERQLFEGLNFTAEDLKANDSRVFVTDAILMAERALRLAGHQGLSFLLARELRLTVHGTLGFAALTSSTLGDALESVRRYLQLRAPFISMGFSDSGDHAIVTLNAEFDVPHLYHFLAETVACMLMMLTDQLIDRRSVSELGFDVGDGSLAVIEVHLTGPEPEYFRKFADQIPVTVKYGQKGEMIVFPKSLLQARMRLADAEASKLARDQCEFELQRALKDQGDITFAIRNMLRVMPGPLPSLEAMAERFCVSSRTLKRRLAEKDTTYREVVESVLKDRAIQLLRYTNQSVSEIAYELGYADLSNFSRAFRKWTGKSASEFREDGPDPAPEMGP